VDAPVKRCERINILEWKRERGQPKKTWLRIGDYDGIGLRS